MQGLTRRQGPWTISHVPGSLSAYDRILGRMTPWALLVEHDNGWRVFSYERTQTVEIVTPGGIPVAVLELQDWCPADLLVNPVRKSEALTLTLTRWVNQHAAEYEEPTIPQA